jgi:hypothetical protein
MPDATSMASFAGAGRYKRRTKFDALLTHGPLDRLYNGVAESAVGSVSLAYQRRAAGGAAHIVRRRQSK